MIWLTWRQFRVQAVTAAAALAVFAILLGATRPHLASLYAASGITGCHGGTPCGTAASHFLSRLDVTSPYPIVYIPGIGLILAAPAIIGIFWGAPLIARELETRTFTLAWNQSITRNVRCLRSGGARAAAVVAAGASFARVLAGRAAVVPAVAPGRPGAFGRPELPPPRAVVAGIAGLGL